MTYVITQKCVGTCDTGCVKACPVDCIVGPVPLDQLQQVRESERGKVFPGIQMFINPEECICCGACTDECPVDAIYEVNAVPAEHHADIERNAAFFKR
jgi:formate hydrogenlyase subunit 6/NADH:ubiquinone oxidoreductase subunit I